MLGSWQDARPVVACHHGRILYCTLPGWLTAATVLTAAFMVLLQGLSIVNSRLQAYANQHPEEVTFLDCGAIFFDGPDRLSDDRLPDALHPSAAGNVISA